MATVNTNMGSSRKREEKVAGVIYLFIALAVCVGVLLFFFIGQNARFNPFHSTEPNKVSPDSNNQNNGNPVSVPPADNPPVLPPQAPQQK